jgi:hypothetical protein
MREKQPAKTKSEEVSIDDLGRWIKNGFAEARTDLLEVKQDLKKEMKYRFDGLQNQLDNIYLNYTRRDEYALLKERVKKIERKVGVKTM